MEPIFYSYVRAVEFEGRYPNGEGNWGVTNKRLSHMEGFPTSPDEFMIPVREDGSFGPTPISLRTSFWPNRNRFYRRIRSADAAARLLYGRKLLGISKACLPLFTNWIEAPDGVISMPSENDVASPDSHAILLFDYLRLQGETVNGEDDALHFVFQNSWGEDWGKDGYGLLPFAYYNRYVFEHWLEYHDSQLKLFQMKQLKKNWWFWQARDEFDRRLYAYEVGEPHGERLGWAFIVETEDAIEVEELFVAPGSRGTGIGGELANLVVKLALAKKMPIRLWIGFADHKSESPQSANAIPHIAKRLGVQFQLSTVPWAAYYATSEHQGSPEPIEPKYFPGRPKATMGSLIALAASVGVAVSNTTPSKLYTGISAHAEVGNKVALTQNSNSVLKPSSTVGTKREWILGMHPGSMVMSPDFDEPLPEDFWLGES